MDNNIAIPTIGTKGKFSFKEPFDKLMNENQEYVVTAIRSIKDMLDSQEDPYEHIYMAAGLNDSDYDTDVSNNIPIVVFIDMANRYYYIPATYLATQVDKTGIQYQEVMLAINVGYLPTKYVFDTIKELIVNDIKASTGIKSTVREVPTSSIVYVPYERHIAYMQAITPERDPLTHEPVDITDYQTRYHKLLNTFNRQQQRLKELEKCAKKYVLEVQEREKNKNSNNG